MGEEQEGLFELGWMLGWTLSNQNSQPNLQYPRYMGSAKTGMESLMVMPISQAAANQRAGRAGRTQPQERVEKR